MTLLLWYLIPLMSLYYVIGRYAKAELAKEHKNRNRDMTKVPLREVVAEGDTLWLFPLIPVANVFFLLAVLGYFACARIGKTKAWTSIVNFKI